MEIRKPSQKHIDISPKHSALAAFSLLATNAALSGEQRRPLNLKHCAVNTKVEANQKCRALGIRLKCFVRYVVSGFAQKQTRTFQLVRLSNLWTSQNHSLPLDTPDIAPEHWYKLFSSYTETLYTIRS